MNCTQKSLKNPIYFKGIGAHSGMQVELEVLPAEADHGIKFHRTDLDQYIEADFRNVTDTSLCTIISNENGSTVATIEHLMSALYGFGIDNALIKVSGQEMPILDGSAKVYSDAIKEVGVIDLDSQKQFIKVLKEVSIHVDDKWISLSPSECFSVEATIDFAHPMIKKQSYRYNGVNNYAQDIADSRTFGFVKDVEQLRNMGLAKGSSVENAIALTDDGIMNDSLRHPDEFIRHKILDCMGDLYLAGNIIAAVSGYKIGHKMNNLILHELFKDPANYEIVTT